MAESKKLLTEEEYDRLPNDEKVSAWWEGRAPRPPREQSTVGWYDASIRAAYWFDLPKIDAVKAAQLLCQANPHNCDADWVEHANDAMPPLFRSELLTGFCSIGGERPLIEWLNIANAHGWHSDPWTVEYLEARDRLGNPVAGLVDGSATPSTAASADTSRQQQKIDQSTYEEIVKRLQRAGLVDGQERVTELPRNWWRDCIQGANLGAKQTLRDRFERHAGRLIGN